MSFKHGAPAAATVSPVGDRTLPVDDVETVRQWAEDRTPPEFRDRALVEVAVGPTSITISEASFMGDRTGWMRVPTALLYYSDTADEWALYRFDSDSFPHRYEFLKPSCSVQDLLTEVDDDPTCIFWG